MKHKTNKANRDQQFTGTRQAVEGSIALSKDDKISTWNQLAAKHIITRWSSGNTAIKDHEPTNDQQSL